MKWACRNVKHNNKSIFQWHGFIKDDKNNKIKTQKWIIVIIMTTKTCTFLSVMPLLYQNLCLIWSLSLNRQMIIMYLNLCVIQLLVIKFCVPLYCNVCLFAHLFYFSYIFLLLYWISYFLPFIYFPEIIAPNYFYLLHLFFKTVTMVYFFFFKSLYTDDPEAGQWWENGSNNLGMSSAVVLISALVSLTVPSSVPH